MKAGVSGQALALIQAKIYDYRRNTLHVFMRDDDDNNDYIIDYYWRVQEN